MSKRNLYKPAPSQTPPRLARRSLTQGRLVSTDPRSLLDNFSPSPSTSKLTPQSQWTVPSRARRSLDYVHSSVSASKRDPLPYEIRPTIAESPSRVKPSSSLSLSDTEGESKGPSRDQAEASEQLTIQPTVLTVDASQRHSSFQDNEVPIKTSYVKSPVKVVCHSPLRQTSRDTSEKVQYAHAGKVKVPVDSVPTVNVWQSENISRINETHSSSSPPMSEEGSLSTVAGSPVDPRSKAIETLVVREKNNPRSYVSFLSEDESVSGSTAMLKALDHSDIHVSQPKFDDTAISSIAGDTTLTSIGEETKKKKRKPRVVQSKYMSSAMSRVVPKSSAAKRSDPPPRMSTASKSTTSRMKKTKTKTLSKPLNKSVNEKKNEPSSRKEKAQVPQFTSTPSEAVHPGITSVSDHVPVITPAPMRSDSIDESLLTPSFFVSGKDLSQKKISAIKDLSHSKDAKPEHSNRSGKQTSGEIGQLQLDLQYARLCQWRFLRSKLKHTFEKQEKDAQEQMYSLWQLNEQLRKKNNEHQIQLETKRKLDEIDRQLELQLTWLKSVDRHSNRLTSDYDGLFEGIDTTRHHIVVKDILLPENEADLLAALDNCENTLGEITSLLQNDQTKVLSFSKEMQVLADTVQEETKEHDRCTELLAAASSLTTQEKSLQAELIQRKEP